MKMKRSAKKCVYCHLWDVAGLPWRGSLPRELSLIPYNLGLDSLLSGSLPRPPWVSCSLSCVLTFPFTKSLLHCFSHYADITVTMSVSPRKNQISIIPSVV